MAAGLLAAGVVLWSLSARPDWTPPWASPGNPDAATAPSPGPGLTTPDDSATAAPAASVGAASAAASAAPTASGVAASLPDGRADDVRREADSGPLLTGLPGTMLDEAGAWRQLAQLWQLGTLEGDPCAALQRRQVHCYRGGGQRNLALLRKLDRPAMLVLQEPSGQGVGHVLLTGLGAQGAVLQVGEQRYAVPLDVLASRWRGDFALLWLPPPGFAPDSPDIGNDGDAARWVKARLDTLSDPSQGGPAASGGDNGPQALRERVQRFQRSQGLVADGLAGPITLMQLNRVTGVDEPHLAHDR